jgi:hypothetical protein
VQLYRYFVGQSSEFCRHNPSRCFSTTVYHHHHHHHFVIDLTLLYESVSKSFRTGRLERGMQMVQLSATRCSCIAILWASVVSFAAITLRVASQLECCCCCCCCCCKRIFRYRFSPETFGYTLVDPNKSSTTLPSDISSLRCSSIRARIKPQVGNFLALCLEAG